MSDRAIETNFDALVIDGNQQLRDPTAPGEQFFEQFQGSSPTRRMAAYHTDIDLVGRSQALVLQIPGADPSAALGRAQAIELLRRHFQSATERNVVVATTREVDPGRGVVELDRHYVVRGTSDQRRESVFLGFRQVQGEWILGEVRTAQ